MNIIIAANAITTRAEQVPCSGSNVRVVQMGRLFSLWGHRLGILTNRYGAEAFKNRVNADYLITATYQRLHHPLVSFLLNSLFSIPHLFRTRPVDLLYASSDLFPDALFGLFYKWFRSSTILIVGCHCLVKHPKQKKKSAARSTLHGFYAYYSQAIILWLLKWRADLILVSNRMDRKQLIDRGLPEEKLMVSHGGPDVENVPTTVFPPKLRYYDIAFIGSDHPVKGIDYLTAALKRILNTRPDTRVCLIGGLNRLKPLFKNYPMVRFVGIRRGKTKYEFLADSKLLLLTSHTESFSMVACEAISCGTPVVAFDIPMLRSIYYAGVRFVPHLGSKAMAKQTLYLLNNPKELEQLSQAAKTFSTRFSWESLGKELIDHVRHLRV